MENIWFTNSDDLLEIWRSIDWKLKDYLIFPHKLVYEAYRDKFFNSTQQEREELFQILKDNRKNLFIIYKSY